MSGIRFERKWTQFGRVLRIGDWSCLTFLPTGVIGEHRMARMVDRHNLRTIRKTIEGANA